jgi:hypothetical protein
LIITDRDDGQSGLEMVDRFTTDCRPDGDACNGCAMFGLIVVQSAYYLVTPFCLDGIDENPRVSAGA